MFSPPFVTQINKDWKKKADICSRKQRGAGFADFFMFANANFVNFLKTKKEINKKKSGVLFIKTSHVPTFTFLIIVHDFIVCNKWGWV